MTPVKRQRARIVKPEVLLALEYLRHTYEALHTNDKRDSHIGHWLNEALVFRLWAVLQAHRVVVSNAINDDLPGAAKLRACKLVRDAIAHSHADFSDARAKEIDSSIRGAFELRDQASILPGKFILSKDRVIRPMLTAAHDYSVALMAYQDHSLAAAPRRI